MLTSVQLYLQCGTFITLEHNKKGKADKQSIN